MKVSHLPLVQPCWLFDGDGETRFLTSISNKITKVNLEKMIHIEQVHFLLYLSPRITIFSNRCFKAYSSSNAVTIYFNKIYYIHSSVLFFICLTNPNVNDEIVHQLQKMIESEKLLTNYMITRIYNNILLKWNWHRIEKIFHQ